MPFDYIAAFPITRAALPVRLQALLSPIGLDPKERVEVACLSEHDPHGAKTEHVYLQMMVVLGRSRQPIPHPSETGYGVVEFSVPAGGKGCARRFLPSISGHDYVVASWGDSSAYSFHLAEKVWMTLGLTPRSFGNNHQRLIYDDLGEPELGVVDGEISNEYYFEATRNVSWTMSNLYFRKYLWLRGARAVRAFFYQALVPDQPELRALMCGAPHVELKPDGGPDWYLLDVREHKGGLLLQVWATSEAAACRRCPEPSATGLRWPGFAGTMDHDRANALISHDPVYLDDRFLERYEQNAVFSVNPFPYDAEWQCNPQYKGRWAFTDCVRVGRNLIRVGMRELYKPKPDREILHAHEFCVSKAEISRLDMQAEHIVAKVQRFADQLIRLGEYLSRMGMLVGEYKTPVELVGMSRTEMDANRWLHYPGLRRLAQVAPFGMTQQSFLARCKVLHEIWQRIPNAFLKALLVKAGCPRRDLEKLAQIKLLEALTNVLEELEANRNGAGSFVSSEPRTGWNKRNDDVAPLFQLNELRIADAHESAGSCLGILEQLGFDVAQTNDGYGLALDHVMDRVIGALEYVNRSLSSLFAR